MKDMINRAFDTIARAEFLPEGVRQYAHEDRPLPIGYKQTNSQPSTVWQMLIWLNAKPGQIILDVGSGSGWTTALLAHITGPAGHVYAVERVPKLVDFGRANCEKLGITNVDFYQAGDEYGLPDKGQFDRILVSASAKDLPPELIGQLKPSGKLVIPVQNDILQITKHHSGRLTIKKHPGFVFVPLI